MELMSTYHKIHKHTYDAGKFADSEEEAAYIRSIQKTRAQIDTVRGSMGYPRVMAFGLGDAMLDDLDSLESAGGVIAPSAPMSIQDLRRSGEDVPPRPEGFILRGGSPLVKPPPSSPPPKIMDEGESLFNWIPGLQPSTKLFLFLFIIQVIAGIYFIIGAINE